MQILFRLSFVQRYRPEETTGMAAASMTVMLEKLDLMVRFWELTARHAAGGEPLAADERIELLSWLQLVTTEVEASSPGPLVRALASSSDAPVPAQVIGAGTASSVEIRAVLARALVVTSAGPLAVGASVLLRVIDAVAGVEYVVPCVVRWGHEGSPCSAALVVDGVPTRKAFGVRSDPKVMQAWVAPARPKGSRRDAEKRRQTDGLN
jgi:hypothetical protein